MALKLINGAKHVMGKRNGALKLNVRLYHGSEESHGETLSAEWYRKAFPKLAKLTRLLKDVDFVDGRLVNINDGSVIVNARAEHKMVAFKSLARVFVGSPLVQQTLWNNVVTWSGSRGCDPFVCFSKPSERQPLVVKSMSIVGSIMNITAQQRQTVRVKICPQVTQHGIWTGALEEILNGLKCELECLDNQCPSKGIRIGQQIVCSCLKFLAETSVSYDDDSASWMRLSHAKINDSSGLGKWEDLLEMFNDLIDCLKDDRELLLYLTKVEVMKEGLSQIKDVLVDKSIGFKEVRHQESLVHKKLSKTLGHSSKCLFTLLLYYLYGHVRDIEVDISGGLYSISDKSLCLCMGRIVTSDEETMIWSGVKQLDRALGLFKFVRETAGAEGVLQLQGHIWCVGAENRTLTYRGCENMEEPPLETLKNKLKEVSGLSTDCCIFRVRKRLREGNEKAYTPQVVSIGPLHHGVDELKSMEEHKILYVRDFLERTKVSIDECFNTLLQWEAKIRGYYAVTFKYNQDQLVKIIMVDGIFTLEVLLRGSFEILRKKNDHIFGKPSMHKDIRYDMLLLENQIPFFVLEYLLSLAYPTSFFPKEHDTGRHVTHVSGPPLIMLTHAFFEQKDYIRPLDEIICKLGQYPESKRILHFVDFLLKCLIPPPVDPPPRSKSRTLTIPTATELHQAGVRFEMVKDENFFDIRFDNGILKIPQLKLHGSSEILFRNLIAYEQCEVYDHYINDYIFFMDRLVDSATDLKLLLKKKIVEFKLSDKEKVADFISSLNSGLVLFSQNFYYTDLCEKLNEYYQVPWHNWKASLKHDYFSSPWAVLSIIAAAVLLVLTFVQTVFTVLK